MHFENRQQTGGNDSRIEKKLRDGLAWQSGVEEVSTGSCSGKAAEP